MEIAVALIIGLLGGGTLGTMFGAFLQRPAAVARVEGEKELRQTRRGRIDMGRALVDEASRENWTPEQVAADVRMSELRQSLDDSLQKTYARPTYGLNEIHVYIPETRHDHGPPERNIDRLEKNWGLG